MFGLGNAGGGPSSASIARIERKLDAIIAHLGIQLPDDGLDEVRDLALAGQKIEAIRLYRAKTGVGLAEAKQMVERGV